MAWGTRGAGNGRSSMDVLCKKNALMSKDNIFLLADFFAHNEVYFGVKRMN